MSLRTEQPIGTAAARSAPASDCEKRRLKDFGVGEGRKSTRAKARDSHPRNSRPDIPALSAGNARALVQGPRQAPLVPLAPPGTHLAMPRRLATHPPRPQPRATSSPRRKRTRHGLASTQEGTCADSRSPSSGRSLRGPSARLGFPTATAGQEMPSSRPRPELRLFPPRGRRSAPRTVCPRPKARPAKPQLVTPCTFACWPGRSRISSSPCSPGHRHHPPQTSPKSPGRSKPAGPSPRPRPPSTSRPPSVRTTTAVGIAVS